MKKARKYKHSLFSFQQYIVFFLLTAFIVTSCMLLFLYGANLPAELLRERATMTFLNVVLLSFLFTLADGVRRKITVERPVKRILEATEKTTSGDLTARIEPFRVQGGNELDVIIDNLNKMAQELSGVETLRTDFVANVSHELKTPLSVMRSYAALLKGPQLPGNKRAEYAETVERASKRMSDLISNILSLNRLESQQIYPKAETFDLGEQLCECALGFEEIWERKSIDFNTNIENIVVKSDPELLALVWNNLLSNALKFTPDGGRVTVSVTQDGERAAVKVTDSGCGMTPEVGRHIFDKFYQGDKSHATEGNGLGLALVKRVVDILGAEISVDSTQDVGTSFTVRLENRC